MTSPVGHSLGAYIFAGRSCHQTKQVFSSAQWATWALILFSANAADLDFLFGELMGDFNGYHRKASHSLMAGFLYASAVGLGARMLGGTALRFAAVAGLSYASHLMLDMITNDTAAPYGMQLLWPFSKQYFIAPQTIFMKIDHGGMNSSLLESLPSIFSRHNLGAIGLELAILAPISLIVFWRRQRRH